MISILIQQLIGGFAIGSMYALVALGISLIWASMKVVNWAQGEFVMVGAYIGLTVYVYWKLPFILALIASAVIVFIIAALVGLIPDSGPHLIFLSLFASGFVPFSILLTSSIVQDGHGTLPLVSFSFQDTSYIKIFNFFFGIIIGGIVFLLGY